MSFLDEKGDFTGYDYEFLQEIAQYTGWDYEFVTLEGTTDEVLTEMLAMLGRGEIDMMGCMRTSEDLAQLYDYPQRSYGTAYRVLCVAQDNYAINSENYITEPVRVALMERAKMNNSLFEQFCQTMDFTPEIVYYDDGDACYEAVRSGAVDAMVLSDSSNLSGLRVVARYAPTPYYFAMAKGKEDLLGQLNLALEMINQTNPLLPSRLYEKYFSSPHYAFHLTDSERAYLADLGPLVAAADPYDSALLRYDEKTGVASGIMADYLNLFSQETGMAISYVRPKDTEDVSRMLKSGDVDILPTMVYDYDVARSLDVAMTHPVLTAQSVLVMNPSVPLGNPASKVMASTGGISSSNLFSSPVLFYPDIRACLEAVSKEGGPDYFVGNAYAVQAEMNTGGYANLSIVPQKSLEQDICIALARPADPQLISIFNKFQRSTTDETMQSLILSSSNSYRGPVTLASFVRDNPHSIATAVSIIVALAAMGLWLSLRRKQGFMRQIELSNERYRQLSSLSGECIFEYDFMTDQLSFSEQGTTFFGSRVHENLRSAQCNDQADGASAIWAFIASANEGVMEVEATLADETRRWVRVRNHVIREKHGAPICSIGKICDISEEKATYAQLLDRAQRDSMTGLYNAAACRQLIGETLHESGALFVIDLDDFKGINDLFGHHVGDRVLVFVSAALRAVFDKDDIVGRTGGDEFMAFMRNPQSPQAVDARCETLRRRVRAIVLGGNAKLSVSVGVAWTRPDLSFDELYKAADQAMYKVKSRGKDGYDIS